ncbi:MAG: 30S ribosomal protein S14 [Alphaproteobacteria bacterium RIFCSPLOWO2_01_FULL_40_26]|nr:MAG: 30S ribosomal protein S14 [Alphaproteobacteria bacterium RIFCSPHIGHO2_02_FULL_40_34]OFW87854.1 MAG: 30S ribosomal protein S14 [Alphaproteobacteria bacterium RIFCSPHIGHO2_01_FULL_40_8]OFW95089.1 MAG: 30S ribosomal protein S14 [Alphaproteobacteria bacterium RIFCSPLOWO2_01_FULL_40_26]OFX09088.1 MAG: 30S ribosomal protein S14 [Alphaproteobacteria bacterium RIFCSPLOWO2_02_FULL_40_19]OFX12170.1 MAG: 30S ribosomal protein S14 [Alphaproteobacteria bacterium RIFCSPLOWO2_12_FULL_40_11]
MAKKSLTRRNEKRRKLSVLHKAKRQKAITIAKDESLSFEERLAAQVKLSQLSRDGSRSRIRNRCSLSGRPRGNLRKFGMSRIAVRELASWGQIPGLIKSSW